MERISKKYFLEYEGPAVEKEIVAGKLGNALLGLEEGVTKICRRDKDLEGVEVVVVANKEGSFIVELIIGVAISVAGNIIANKLEDKLKNFTNQFRIKKFAKGKKLKAVPKFGNEIELTNEDNDIINVHIEDYEIHQSKIIDKDISRIVEALEEEKVTKLYTGLTDTKYIETVDVKEKPYFIYREDYELPELEDQKKVSLSGEIISFNKKYKTIGFMYKDTIISCRPALGKKVVEFVEFAKSANVKLHGQVYRPDKGKPPIIYIDHIDWIQPPIEFQK
jgi:RNase P/RNase MRP subunit p29